MMAGPVETKAVAGGLGAGAGAITAQFVDYLLQITAYHHHDVPGVVSDFVLVAVSTAFALAAAWLAPHTHTTPPAA